jgi:hypothetical protein
LRRAIRRLKNIDVRIGVLDAIIARHKGPVRAGSRMESRNFGKFLGTLSESASTSVRFYIAGPSSPNRDRCEAQAEQPSDRMPPSHYAFLPQYTVS